MRPQVRDPADDKPINVDIQWWPYDQHKPGIAPSDRHGACLRAALAESTDLSPFMLGGTIDPEASDAAEADGAPREFLDFCRVLDGLSCGPSVQFFGLEEAEEHQFSAVRWPTPRCPSPRRSSTVSG